MAADAPNAIPTNAPQADARQVALQKFYVKDASVEVPLAPQVFTRPWQPQVDVNVGTAVQPLGDDQFNLTLTVGIFVVRGFTNENERAAILAGYCPSLLFPFAREAVSDFVQKAGFPQLLLQPINFEALFLEHVNRQRAAAAAGQAGADANVNVQVSH
jgi:preprotein translocase subunit SecB